MIGIGGEAVGAADVCVVGGPGLMLGGGGGNADGTRRRRGTKLAYPGLPSVVTCW